MLAVLHTMGNLLTNVSLGKVAVSFTHTIKAMEPFFTVVLAAMFLGEVRILGSTNNYCSCIVLFREGANFVEFDGKFYVTEI